MVTKEKLWGPSRILLKTAKKGLANIENINTASEVELRRC
jgi:hypothetical protein